MNFREWVEKLRANGKLTEAKKNLSSHLEAAAFIKALEPKPTLLHIEGSEIPVAATSAPPVTSWPNTSTFNLAKLLQSYSPPLNIQLSPNGPTTPRVSKFRKSRWT